LLSEKMADVRGAPRAAQLARLKELLQSKDFALQIAAWQDGAYYRGQGKTPPPFLTPEEKAGKVEKSVADEKIAMNLAGFYAVESGLGVLAETTGKSPRELLRSIVDGTMPEGDMLLIARFANATWKAGQPFRSLDRITRDTFRPAALLTDEELAKDFDQIKAAAQKLLERVSVLEVAGYADKPRREALEALKASDMPAGDWLDQLSHPIDTLRRLLGLRLLDDAQVEAVMSAHNDVLCNVYRCTPAQLLAKARIMKDAGIPAAVREKLLREGYAGSLDAPEAAGEKADGASAAEPAGAEDAGAAAGADQTASFAESAGIGAPPPVPMENIPTAKSAASSPAWKTSKDGSLRLYSHIMEFELSPEENGPLYRPRQIVGGGHTQAALDRMLKDVSESLSEKRALYEADRKKLAELTLDNKDPRMFNKLMSRLTNNANKPPPPVGEHWTEKPNAIRILPPFANGVKRVVLPEDAYAKNTWNNMMSIAKWTNGYVVGGKTLFPDGWTSADIKGASEEVLNGGSVVKDDAFGKIIRGTAARRGQSILIDVSIDSAGRISTTYPS
ncbi:MAG TPA: hypothetical protein VH309_15335, partial [Elusimicrobiota bacterium]|nr:hypothetical protein [Elusimicrobiota bacterium]